MAICLRRNFRSCGSFVFVGRRNHQTNCFDQKSSNAVAPFFKEMTHCDYSPLTVPRSHNQHPRVMANLQVPRDHLPQSRDENFVYHLKDLTFDLESYTKLNCIRLEDARVYCARECKAYKENDKEPGNNPGRPVPEQLKYIVQVLSHDLPELFRKPMNYKIYHQNMIFENNIRGTKTIGLFGYVKELALVKIIGHIKFARVALQVLKITAHPEDGTVRVRWRIIGVSNYKAFFSFLKQNSGKLKDQEGWYDGFSVFYVRSDGLVHKHTVDKMMPDSEEKIPSIKNNLAAKMALALGIMIKDFSPASLSFEEIQEKYSNFFEILHSLENLEHFSKGSDSSDLLIHLNELENKSSQEN